MASETRTEAVLAVLRRPPHRPQLFGGFGPLVVGAVLVVLMMVLLPSVAPERLVERPVAPEPATDTTVPDR